MFFALSLSGIREGELDPFCPSLLDYQSVACGGSEQTRTKDDAAVVSFPPLVPFGKAWT